MQGAHMKSLTHEIVPEGEKKIGNIQKMWDALPCDLVWYIYAWRAAPCVQRMWRGYRTRILLGRYRLMRYFHIFRVFNPNVSVFLARSRL